MPLNKTETIYPCYIIAPGTLLQNCMHYLEYVIFGNVGDMLTDGPEVYGMVTLPALGHIAKRISCDQLHLSWKHSSQHLVATLYMNSKKEA